MALFQILLIFVHFQIRAVAMRVGVKNRGHFCTSTRCRLCGIWSKCIFKCLQPSVSHSAPSCQIARQLAMCGWVIDDL